MSALFLKDLEIIRLDMPRSLIKVTGGIEKVERGRGTLIRINEFICARFAFKSDGKLLKAGFRLKIKVSLLCIINFQVY